MGLMTGFKANKAYRLQKNGDTDEAVRLYEECFAEGLNDARYNLAYALLIIRKGEYQKAKDFLVKHQKTPGMTPDQRTTLLVDYAACCFRLGDLDKGVSTLEQQFRKAETGLLYQTLGYLYVEQYDPAGRSRRRRAPRKKAGRKRLCRRRPRRKTAGRGRKSPPRRRPRRKPGRREWTKRRTSSAAASSTTRKTPSAWTIWASSCTG